MSAALKFAENIRTSDMRDTAAAEYENIYHLQYRLLSVDNLATSTIIS